MRRIYRTGSAALVALALGAGAVRASDPSGPVPGAFYPDGRQMVRAPDPTGGVRPPGPRPCGGLMAYYTFTCKPFIPATEVARLRAQAQKAKSRQ